MKLLEYFNYDWVLVAHHLFRRILTQIRVSFEQISCTQSLDLDLEQSNILFTQRLPLVI